MRVLGQELCQQAYMPGGQMLYNYKGGPAVRGHGCEESPEGLQRTRRPAEADNRDARRSVCRFCGFFIRPGLLEGFIPALSVSGCLRCLVFFVIYSFRQFGRL